MIAILATLAHTTGALVGSSLLISKDPCIRAPAHSFTARNSAMLS